MKTELLIEIIKQNNIISKVRDTFPDDDIYLIGGFPRDVFLSRETFDYDFAVPTNPLLYVSKLKENFKGSITQLSDRFKTYRWVFHKKTFDFTQFKGDNLDEDLQNRDLTINSLCINIRNYEIIDKFGALNDIQNKRIVKLNPNSFEDDPLRILRVFRYKAIFNFTINDELISEIIEKANLLEKIAMERIKYELDIIFSSKFFNETIELLFQTNVIFVVFPELKAIKNFLQNSAHTNNLYNHTISSLLHLSTNHFTNNELRILRYTMLFHDIGKTTTKSIDKNGNLHFYGHEKESERIFRENAKKHKFSNKELGEISYLIKNHMKILKYSLDKIKDETLKYFIYCNLSKLDMLLAMTLADKFDTNKKLEFRNKFNALKDKITKFRNIPEVTNPPKFLNGYEIGQFGAKGKNISIVLEKVINKTVSGFLKNKNDAIIFAKNLVNNLNE